MVGGALVDAGAVAGDLAGAAALEGGGSADSPPGRASVAAQEARAANADYVLRLVAAHIVQLCRPDEAAEASSQI